MAIQVTKLACGAFAIAARIAHPLADISSLVNFVKHWARISRETLTQGSIQNIDQPRPPFDPALLDAMAAGDINADESDARFVKEAENLPFHRYDWWAPNPDYLKPYKIPTVFKGEDILPAGNPLHWDQWDVKVPVSHYTVHLDREQVQQLHR